MLGFGKPHVFFFGKEEHEASSNFVWRPKIDRQKF